MMSWESHDIIGNVTIRHPLGTFL